MLIRFNSSNFRSFNEETEFNMLASTPLKNHKDHVYRLKNGISVLKASAIYGANGAGKSNLVRAINSLKEIVKRGYIPKNVDFVKNRFKTNAESHPIMHEVEFSLGTKIYTYGIVFMSDLCLEEWLYETGIKEPKIIFERKYSKTKKHSVIKVNAKYQKTDKDRLLITLMEENLLKNHELLISKNENLKFKEIDAVIEWFLNKLVFIYPETKTTVIYNGRYSDSVFKQFSENILHVLDVGIDKLYLKSEELESFMNRERLKMEERDMEVLKRKVDETGRFLFKARKYAIVVTKEKDKYVVERVVTAHEVDGKETVFEVLEESDGTQRLFDFIPLISSLLTDDKTYVVDEFDRSLHPHLLHKLVEKIMEGKTKGQLVFTTHESGLLDCKIFRADEIWFAEKDRETQSTRLYTLAEFKPRYDLDLEKGYLNGRFGAIPFLSKLEDLDWDSYGL